MRENLTINLIPKVKRKRIISIGFVFLLMISIYSGMFLIYNPFIEKHEELIGQKFTTNNTNNTEQEMKNQMPEYYNDSSIVSLNKLVGELELMKYDFFTKVDDIDKLVIYSTDTGYIEDLNFNLHDKMFSFKVITDTEDEINECINNLDYMLTWLEKDTYVVKVINSDGFSTATFTLYVGGDDNE